MGGGGAALGLDPRRGWAAEGRRRSCQWRSRRQRSCCWAGWGPVGHLGLPGPVRRHRRRRPRPLLRRRRRRSRSSGAARPANVGRYRVLPLWITGGTIHSRLLIGGAIGGAMGHLQVLQFQISGFTILISSINSKQFQIKTTASRLSILISRLSKVDDCLS